VILVTAISSFQVFDMVFVLTRGGTGTASMLVPIYMLDNAFTFHKVGYGAAVAIVLGIVILGLSVVFMFFRGVTREAAE
jgi:ABC-type sugar transport system permease subunit